MLEKFLTLPKEVFDKYLRSKPRLSLPEREGKRDAFRFTKVSFCEREELGNSLIKYSRQTISLCVHSSIVMMRGYPEAVYLTLKRVLACLSALICSILKKILDI